MSRVRQCGQGQGCETIVAGSAGARWWTTRIVTGGWFDGAKYGQPSGISDRQEDEKHPLMCTMYAARRNLELIKDLFHEAGA